MLQRILDADAEAQGPIQIFRERDLWNVRVMGGDGCGRAIGRCIVDDKDIERTIGGRLQSIQTARE